MKCTKCNTECKTPVFRKINNQRAWKCGCGNVNWVNNAKPAPAKAKPVKAKAKPAPAKAKPAPAKGIQCVICTSDITNQPVIIEDVCGFETRKCPICMRVNFGTTANEHSQRLEIIKLKSSNLKEAEVLAKAKAKTLEADVKLLEKARKQKQLEKVAAANLKSINEDLKDLKIIIKKRVFEFYNVYGDIKPASVFNLAERFFSDSKSENIKNASSATKIIFDEVDKRLVVINKIRIDKELSIIPQRELEFVFKDSESNIGLFWEKRYA